MIKWLKTFENWHRLHQFVLSEKKYITRRQFWWNQPLGLTCATKNSNQNRPVTYKINSHLHFQSYNFLQCWLDVNIVNVFVNVNSLACKKAAKEKLSGEKFVWWVNSPVVNCPVGKIVWWEFSFWENCLVGKRPGRKMTCWANVWVEKWIGGKTSRWETRLVGKRAGGKMAQWEINQVG